jgi:hypothetical protein
MLAISLAAVAVARPEVPSLRYSALCSAVSLALAVTTVTVVRHGRQGWGVFLSCMQLVFALCTGAWSAAGAALCMELVHHRGASLAALAMLAWAVVAAEAGRVFTWLLLYPALAPVGCLCIFVSVLRPEGSVRVLLHVRDLLEPPGGHTPLRPLPLHNAPASRRYLEGDVVTLSADYARHADAAAGPLEPRTLGIVRSVQGRVRVAPLRPDNMERLLMVPPGGFLPTARPVAASDPVRPAVVLHDIGGIHGSIGPGDVAQVLAVLPRVGVQVRRLVGADHQVWLYDRGALELTFPVGGSAGGGQPAAPAAPTAPGPNGFTVGSCVRLAGGYEEHADAADGPLCRAHDVAVVLEASGDGARVRPIRLRAGDADVPYAPSMLRRANPAAADVGELREGDLVRAVPGAETYADLVRDALGAGSVGVVVAAAVENTVTVRRLHEEGDSWYYEAPALEAAPTMAALRALLARPASAPHGHAAAADAPLRLDQLVRLADSDDDDDGEAWLLDSDAEGGDETVNSRLRGSELGIVTRVRRGGVDARRLGTAHSCRYSDGMLTRPAAAVAAAAAAPFVVGERVVRRTGYRGPLPSTTRGARLLRGHVGIVAELTGTRVRVTGHNGITLAYRPDALERAPASRERRTPPDDAVPAVAVTLRAGMHGHPIGARNAEWPLMARYGGRCDVCSDETPASSAARCTLGCHFDLCATCLAPELRGDGAADDDEEELSAAELIAAHSAGGGASASAPTSAPFLALHEHTLAGLADAATYPLMRTFRGTLRLAWSCNVCSRRFSGADDRHRCTAGCDWDCCGECATTALLGLTAPPLQPGDAVVLAPGFASFGDAADGPLRPGDVGLVAALQPADRLSVQVLPPGVKDAANARAWWYMRSALDPAPKQEVAATSSTAASDAESSSGGILAPVDSATSSASGWDFFAAPPAAGLPRAGDEQLPAPRVEALRSRIVACALRGAAAADEEYEAAGMRAASAPINSDEVMDHDDHDTDDDDDDEDEDAEGLSEQLAVTIARDAVLRSSMWALGPPTGEKWRRPLRVIFTATTGGRPEEGVDGGGLTREWYAATSRALMRMPALVPTANDNGEVYFNPAACSAADLQACEFLGALLGRALVEGSAPARVARLGHTTLGGIRLCDAFYKVLLGAPLTLADVSDVSAPDARALRALLDAPRPEELCLGAFVHEVFAPGGAGGAAPCAVLPLRPGGASVPITRHNRHEYVLLKAQSLLMTSVAKQLDAACSGFFALVPAAVLRGSGITPRQLRRLLCGAGDGFNVAELHRLARYSAPYSPRHRVIVWLWQTLLEGGPAMQCDFLEFVTGSPSPPANGFAALAAALPAGTHPLTISQVPLRGEGPALRLPQAHTCSCTLDLPPYESKDVLRERLLQALPYKNAYGFG